MMDDLFLTATTALYNARRSGNMLKADAILSLFDADARRAVIVGAAALMAMGDGEYRDAMKAAIWPVLYAEMKGGARNV